jgi:protein ImuA
MTQPNAQTVLRNRAAVAEELRRLLPKMEGLRAVRALPLGVEAIDRHLPKGGLGCGGLHEIVPEAGATPAAFGFLVALLARIFFPPPERGRSASVASQVGVSGPRHNPSPDCLWRSGLPLSGEGKVWRAQPPAPPSQGGREKILLVLPAYGLRDYGRPHGHGLHTLGLPPHRLILAETAHRKDTLWAMEEALHARAVAAIAGFIDQLDLKNSQRLQLAATDCGLPLFLLRPALSQPSPAHGRGLGEGSAAATRWRVGTAPSARDRFGLIAHARWRLSLERCRNGRTGEWMVEYDHVAHRFSLATALADPALSRRAGETGERSLRRAQAG